MLLYNEYNKSDWQIIEDKSTKYLMSYMQFLQISISYIHFLSFLYIYAAG